ncbi:MAG: hypothetical protein D6816_15015 [Bacteroidetes bacterium]|nr:MAG: hypothetical protein D6816_15015 [Bacteroidota bacterium]
MGSRGVQGPKDFSLFIALPLKIILIVWPVPISEKGNNGKTAKSLNLFFSSIEITLGPTKRLGQFFPGVQTKRRWKSL